VFRFPRLSDPAKMPVKVGRRRGADFRGGDQAEPRRVRARRMDQPERPRWYSTATTVNPAQSPAHYLAGVIRTTVLELLFA